MFWLFFNEQKIQRPITKPCGKPTSLLQLSHMNLLTIAI